MTRRHKWLVGAGILLLAIGISFPWWIPLPGTLLVNSSPAAPADGLVVLAGDSYGYRVKEGANLVHQGIAPKVLVSGNNWYYGLWECELAIDMAVNQGQPREIFEPFRHEATSTEEELRMIFAEAGKRGWKSMVLVTSNFHTLRTGMLVDRTKPPDLRVQVVASDDRYFKPQEWWWHRESRKLLFMEWVKLGAALVGGL